MNAGLVAEYATPEAMLEALTAVRARGYNRLDAFTPYPIRGVDAALHLRRSPVPILVLCAAAIGAGGAYFLEWWMNAYNYPINVGGRPPHSALAFVPITFEMGVLFAGICAFIAVFAFGRLTTLHHPLFGVTGFESATIDRFWIGVDAADPLYDLETTRAALLETHPLQIVEVVP